jgi:hypothetical protein
MGATVAGTSSVTRFRPLRSYTTLWDVTRVDAVLLELAKAPRIFESDERAGSVERTTKLWAKDTLIVGNSPLMSAPVPSKLCSFAL